MKRIIAFALCLVLMLPQFGCASEEMRSPGLFYYRRSATAYGVEDGVIASEQRELAGMETDLDALLEAYFAGPESGELQSPFPRDSRVVSWQLEDGILRLTMSDDFAALSGVELTIACACIAKTLLGITGADQISLQAESVLLSGERAILLTSESIRLYDDSLDQSRAEFTVYYADRQRRYLIAEEISVSLATENDIVAYLVEALLTAPDDSSLVSALPAGTRLLDYSVSDGICTINFSGEFDRSCLSQVEAQRLTLLSVVNTLTQLEDIDQVEFCAEGNLLVQYGLINLSGPLVFEENAIGPVRTSMNEFDATLYLANGTEQYLAAVPTRLRQSTGISQAELVVEALASHTARNGFYSTIPEGTTVNSVELRSGVCYVDLSGAFLSSEEHLVTSVHSIIASVCALEDIYRAQITVNGAVPEGDYAYLFAVMSPQPDWFV